MQATNRFSTDLIYLQLLITRKVFSNVMERERNRHYIQHFFYILYKVF